MSAFRWLAAAVAVAAAASVMTGCSDSSNTPINQGSAVVTLNPATYIPAQATAVSIQVTPPPGTQNYTVVETAPAGFTLSNASSGGTISGNSVTFAFPDGQARTLSFSATPPVGATGSQVFSGQATFGTTVIQTTGNQTTTLNNTFQQGSAVVTLSPTTFTPLHPTSVSIAVTPRTGVTSYSVTEVAPTGFVLTNASNGGVITNNSVTFSVTDGLPHTFTFTATPPAGATGVQTFTGHANFGSATINTTGTQTLPANTPPTARLTVTTPGAGTTNDTFTADASASTDVEDPASALTFSFDFGDGTVTSFSATKTATHVYATPGTKTITVTVKDSKGLPATASRTVTVVAAGSQTVTVH